MSLVTRPAAATATAAAVGYGSSHSSVIQLRDMIQYIQYALRVIGSCSSCCCELLINRSSTSRKKWKTGGGEEEEETKSKGLKEANRVDSIRVGKAEMNIQKKKRTREIERKYPWRV